jgi:hypothetical protein
MCVSDTWSLDKRISCTQLCFSDFLKISRILQILDKKQILIDHLHLLNDFMDTVQHLSKMEDVRRNAQYQYAWVLHQLEKANRELALLLCYIQSRVISISYLHIAY